MTVSRVLHGKEGVGQEIRKRVQETATRLGYTKNRDIYPITQIHSPMTVGVIVPHLSNTIFPQMIQSIERVLGLQRYHIFLFCNYNDPLKEYRDISALLERQPSGIIWAPLHISKSLKAAKLICKRQCPLVFIDRKLPNIETDSVTVDDFEGARSVVRHLISHGRRRLAFFCPDEESYVSIERQKGFEAALQEAELKPYCILNVGTDIEAGRRGIDLLFEKESLPDAIFCFNDPLAVGAEMELLARNISIPQDVMLAGFSGTIECEISRVPLTTVVQDADRLGTEAALLLLNRMLNPHLAIQYEQRVIKTHMVIRESTGTLPVEHP